MIYQNLHTHTTFDDGKNTVTEMVQAAIIAGLTSIGFSGHSILPYQNDWSMTEEGFPLYLEEIGRVRDLFREKLPVYLGLEWDHISSSALLKQPFDFIIGSVHHLQAVNERFTVDESAVSTQEALDIHYHGNALRFAEDYYSQYQVLANDPRIGIIGHFDLITKFDETFPIFPTDSDKYMLIATDALDMLVKKDKIFEVNTGAMSRGYRKTPYPSAPLLKEILRRGGRITVSSDAHSSEAIAYAFREAEELLISLGYHEIWELSDTGFSPVPL